MISNLIFGQHAQQYFIHFLKLNIKLHSQFIYPLGSTPLRIKVQMSNFEIPTHKLGVLHIPPLKINTVLGVIIKLLELNLFKKKNGYLSINSASLS